MRYHLDVFADGIYFLRRTYVGGSSSGVDEIGKWNMAADGRLLELRGQREPELFEMRDATTLRKLDLAGKPIESEHNYDLKRQPAFEPIEPTLRLRGAYSYTADAATFTECMTGRRLLVAQKADPQRIGGPELRGCDVERNTREHLLETHSAAQSTGRRCRSSARAAPDLHSDDKRVAGSGGCNQLMGSYTLDGDQLALGRLVSTRRACSQGMELEQDFLTALPSVRRWRINGEQLELLDEGDGVVAQFARSMK